MTITLDLPPQLEQELATEASHLKLPLAEYILRVDTDSSPRFRAFRIQTQRKPEIHRA